MSFITLSLKEQRQREREIGEQTQRLLRIRQQQQQQQQQYQENLRRQQEDRQFHEENRLRPQGEQYRQQQLLLRQDNQEWYRSWQLEEQSSVQPHLQQIVRQNAQEEEEPQQLRQQQQNEATPPPASHRAISNLPLSYVTVEDLFESSNRECLICLGEHCIGMKASKLPCGHLFHRQCLSEWLSIHCTCPVCRFEMETDDAAYEKQRTNKMKKWKLRCRRDELESKPINQLIELMGSLDVSAVGCIYKQDLVNRLVQSGRITITVGAPAIEMTSDDFSALTRSQLEQILTRFGIDFSEAIFDDDLRNLLYFSGRIVLVEESSQPSITTTSTEKHSSIRLSIAELSALTVVELDELTNDFGLSDTGVIDKISLRAVLVDFECVSVHEKLLSLLSVQELTDFMAAFDIPTKGCVERSELIGSIRDSDTIIFISEV